MGYWNVIERIPFDQTTNREPDGVQLHQNDWSYAGVATALAKAVRRRLAAGRPPRSSTPSGYPPAAT
jgi:hypothetical protein